MEAPLDWHYPLFPLMGEGEEALPLDWVVDRALAMMERARITGDGAHFGAVPHWAHVLKTAQGPDGRWPTVVNARTGEALGPERTVRPADLMERLDALFDSTEYQDVVLKARHARQAGDNPVVTPPASGPQLHP